MTGGIGGHIPRIPLSNQEKGCCHVCGGLHLYNRSLDGQVCVRVTLGNRKFIELLFSKINK